MEAYDELIRERAIVAYESGQKLKKISEAMGVGYSTLRQWIKRYKADGKAGLKTQYWKCGKNSKVDHQITQEAIALKGDHQDWGAGFIRIKLTQKYPKSYIPSVRQLQRYFVKAEVLDQKDVLPQSEGCSDWAHRPFYRVQVDAKEQLQTADGKDCCYLTFTDEHSGAILDCLSFPPQVYPSSPFGSSL